MLPFRHTVKAKERYKNMEIVFTLFIVYLCVMIWAKCNRGEVDRFTRFLRFWSYRMFLTNQNHKIL